MLRQQDSSLLDFGGMEGAAEHYVQYSENP